jgi:hypothetical protein
LQEGAWQFLQGTFMILHPADKSLLAHARSLELNQAVTGRFMSENYDALNSPALTRGHGYPRSIPEFNLRAPPTRHSGVLCLVNSLAARRFREKNNWVSAKDVIQEPFSPAAGCNEFVVRTCQMII